LLATDHQKQTQTAENGTQGIATCLTKLQHIVTYLHTVKRIIIEAPGFYQNKLLLPPACIGDPAFIKTLSTCRTRV